MSRADKRKRIAGAAAVLGALLSAAPSLEAQADTVAALGAEVLALERETRAMQPAVSTLYVGNAAGSLRLRRVSLRIDDGPAQVYEYSTTESDALSRGALHRFEAPALAAGRHRLRVELIARHAEARPDTPRVEARLDQAFEHTGAARDVSVSLALEGLRKTPVVQVNNWGSAPETAHPRVADFLDASGQPWRAAAARLHAPAAVVPVPTTDARPLYARYNGGVELLRGGLHAEGIAALDALGRVEPKDAEALALRDRANVVLGYQLLRLRRGADAVPVFQRVRSPGPYGNPALLGLGWAHLMPRAGDVGTSATDAGLWPAFDDSPLLRRRVPFRYSWSVAGGEREKDLRAALAAWTELNGREATDPAVQEGMLALAYGLNHLGAHEQAQRHHLRAIERLEETRRALTDAIAQVSGGVLVESLFVDTPDGWRRQLADLPYADDTAYLRPLAADAGFIDAYERRRALHELSLMLAEQRLRAAGHPDLRRRIESFAPRLRSAADAEQARMEHAAIAALQALQRHTESYLAEARFAVARMHDPSPRALEARSRGVSQ